MEAISKRKMDDIETQGKLHGVEVKKKIRGASDLEKDWNKLKNMGISIEER